eukprot:c17985_g1_i1.p1 GENE.c17985_g1_i1~~c17985_g1_i1.p1  ORF type:complete len:328 (-),score=101.02 c17985_g1_i1:4-987(-)
MTDERQSAEEEWQAMIAAAKSERFMLGEEESDSGDEDVEFLKTQEGLPEPGKTEVYSDIPQFKQIPRKKIIRKQGFLKKQGNVVKNWKQRFFVLEGATVRYYESQLSFEKLDPKGGFHIDKESKVTIGLGEQNMNDHGYLFSLNIPSDKQSRLWVFASDSENERKKWVSTFQRVVEDLSAPQLVPTGIDIQPSSSSSSLLLAQTISSISTSSAVIAAFYKEGILFKLGKKIKSWKKRYFVSSGDIVRYYKSEEHFVEELRPKGGFRLEPTWKITKGFADIDSNKIGYLFVIGSESTKTSRNWILAAINEQEREGWMRYFEYLLGNRK